MKRALWSAVAAVLLVACGGSDGDDSASGAPPPDTASADDPSLDDDGADTDTGGAAIPGSVDCAAVLTAFDTAAAAIQLMPQLDDVSDLENYRPGGVVAFDSTAAAGALETLRQLDSVESPLGAPGPAIDRYVETAVALGELLDDDQAGEAEVAAYQELVGELGEFLSGQSAITAAAGEAGC